MRSPLKPDFDRQMCFCFVTIASGAALFPNRPQKVSKPHNWLNSIHGILIPSSIFYIDSPGPLSRMKSFFDAICKLKIKIKVSSDFYTQYSIIPAFHSTPNGRANSLGGKSEPNPLSPDSLLAEQAFEKPPGFFLFFLFFGLFLGGFDGFHTGVFITA